MKCRNRDCLCDVPTPDTECKFCIKLNQIKSEKHDVLIDAGELEELREANRELLTIKAEIFEHYQERLGTKGRFPARLFMMIGGMMADITRLKTEVFVLRQTRQ